MASTLGFSFIGVADLDRSLEFYRDIIGLDASPPVPWSERSLAEHWQAPHTEAAQTVLLGFPGSDVGRVVLVEFGGQRRREVREARERMWIGLGNLNFYTKDIEGAAKQLRSSGFDFWSDPVHYEMSEAVGSPTEVVFEAPDSVPVNLVQLVAGTATQTGEMAAFLDAHGMTRTGFTQVTTSAHYVRDIDAAVAFHDRVLGMKPLIDETLTGEGPNRLLSLPPDAKTRVVFVKGRHMFGKVALCAPLNYEAVDLAVFAEPPNIGYLAMGFDVADVSAAVSACRDLGAVVVADVHEVEFPHLGKRTAAVVRAAGSGGRYHLYETQPL